MICMDLMNLLLNLQNFAGIKVEKEMEENKREERIWWVMGEVREKIIENPFLGDFLFKKIYNKIYSISFKSNIEHSVLSYLFIYLLYIC